MAHDFYLVRWPLSRVNTCGFLLIIPIISKCLVSSQSQMADRQKMLEEKLQELQAEEDTLVKLGDASIASPFTSKYSSVKCVCSIIRQV